MPSAAPRCNRPLDEVPNSWCSAGFTLAGPFAECSNSDTTWADDPTYGHMELGYDVTSGRLRSVLFANAPYSSCSYGDTTANGVSQDPPCPSPGYVYTCNTSDPRPTTPDASAPAADAGHD